MTDARQLGECCGGDRFRPDRMKLWRMKAVTRREKNAPELVFLRQWFPGRGEAPPKL